MEDSRPWDVAQRLPGGQTPPSVVSDAVLTALRKMQEDNLQLRREMQDDTRQLRMEMQHLFNALSPHSSAVPQAASASLDTPPPGQHHLTDSGMSFAQLPVPPLASTPMHPGRHQSLPQSKDGGQDTSGHGPPTSSLPMSQQNSGPNPQPHLPQQMSPSPYPPSQLIAELTEHLRSIYLMAEPGQDAPAPPDPVRTPEYMVPYTPPRLSSARLPQPPLRTSTLRTWGQGLNSQPPSPHRPVRTLSPPQRETSYRGPKPQIPLFTDDDPHQFAQLKLALDSLLPADTTERFKLALQRINDVLAESPIKSRDIRGFQLFTFKVRALVGMLDQLGREGKTELECGSHVTRLLSKLPHDLRAQFKRFINPLTVPIPTLLDFAE